LDTSSIISVAGCINITNVSLVVDLSKYSNLNKLVLMNSSNGCLNIESYSISFLNQPNCVQQTRNGNDSFSIYVIFTQDNCEVTTIGHSSSLPAWEIAIIVVVFLWCLF